MSKINMLVEKFVPDNYNINLIFSENKDSYSGQVIIDGRKISQPTKRITLHQKDLIIDSAQVTKFYKSETYNLKVQRIVCQNKLQEVRLHFNELIYPGQYQLIIKFHNQITKKLTGIYPSFFKDKNNQQQKLIATQFESHYARQAFPCIDEPNAKATFQISITTNQDDHVLSNTLIQTETKNANQKTVTFKKTPRMSTYLVAFVIGQLESKSLTTEENITISCHAIPGHLDELNYSLKVAQQTLQFFSHFFNIPYPLKKLDLVALPDFSAGAMENWGLITFRDTYLLFKKNDNKISSMQNVALVVAHEIAHQWFGNLVTMKWWNDLWLNESFANLMEYIAVDHLNPDWKIMEEFTNYTMALAKSRDSLKDVQSLRVNIKHAEEIETIFDNSIVYAKGGSVLYMLLNYIGLDNFKLALKNYFTKYQYSNTEANNLWQEMSEVSQLDIGRFMDNWLNQPGFPLVSIDLQPQQKRFHVSQQRLLFKSSKNESSTIWSVPLSGNYPLKADILEKKEKYIFINQDLQANKPLILNHQSKSYFAPLYLNQQHFQDILVNLSNFNPIDQNMLISNYNLLQKNLLIDVLQVEKMIPYYRHNRNKEVWSNIAALLSTLKRIIEQEEPQSIEKLNQLVHDFIKPVVQDVGLSSTKEEQLDKILLREEIFSIGVTFNYQPIIDYCKQAFQDKLKNKKVDNNLLNEFYRVAIKDDKNFDILLELHNDSNSQNDRNEYMLGLSYTTNPELIDRLLKLLLSKDIRHQDLSFAFIDLIYNHKAFDQAWQWFKDNYHQLEIIFQGEGTIIEFPRYIASAMKDKTQLNDYINFFKPQINQPNFKRTIELGIVQIKQHIEWRQYNQPLILNWIHQADSL